MKLTPIMISLALAGIISTLPMTSWAETSPKAAAAATKQANDALYKQLPFSDNTDFTNAHKGFIAALPTEVIKGEQGNVIWNPQQYNFVKEGEKAPDTVNPSLWRQSQLINISGLFEVTEGVYQIRNLDLSNMTIIEGKEGITVVDPLVSAETAKVGMDLYYKNRGNKPVVAVIYTHSHVDHYGGVRGVVDEADVKSGKVKIYAPSGFMEAAVAENIMAGNVMSRRASYMYGNLLKPDATGGWRRPRHHDLRRHRHVDCSHQYHRERWSERDHRRADLRFYAGAGLRSTVGNAVVYRREEAD